MKQRKMSFIIIMAILPYVFLFVGMIILFTHFAIVERETRVLTDETDSAYQISVEPFSDGVIVATDDLAELTSWSYYDNLSGEATCDQDSARYQQYYEGDPLKLLPNTITSRLNFDSNDNQQTSYAPVCLRVESPDGHISTYYYNPQSLAINASVVISSLVAIGLGLLLFVYPLIWLIKTKGELTKLGADIPSSWLLIVPLANYYYVYKYGEESQKLTGGSLSGILALLLFFFELLPVMMMIYQGNYNKLQTPGAQTNSNIPPPGFGQAMPTIGQLANQPQPTQPQPATPQQPPTPNPAQPLPPTPAGPQAPPTEQPPPPTDQLPKI